MLNNTLIENTLALCEYMYDDFEIDEWHYQDGDQFHYKYFSIEKFCYYLLSPEFIEKYFELINYNLLINIEIVSAKFGIAIFQYQKGNETLLIELLSKIGN